jgi:hypothetical protein
VLLTKTSKTKRFKIYNANLIAACMMVVCLIKALSFTPLIYHFLSGSKGFRSGMAWRLFTEYLPKCYSPTLIFITNCVLLRLTAKEMENRGLFDDWHAFPRIREIFVKIQVFFNVALFMCGFLSFLCESVAVYRIHHGSYDVIAHIWFWRGYILLAISKFTVIIFTTHFLIFDIYLFNTLRTHSQFQGELLHTSKMLLGIHVLIGVTTLIAHTLSSYGYLDDQWLELVWIGDTLFLIAFFISFMAIGPLNLGEGERLVLGDDEDTENDEQFVNETCETDGENP